MNNSQKIARETRREALGALFDIVATVGIAVGAVLIIRAYIIQPFLVSGRSMEPALQDGDYLLVDEVSYKMRAPERGEIVVFNHGDNSIFIKRIIGLPGEIITNKGGGILVSGGEQSDRKTIEEPYAVPSRTFGEFTVKLGENEYYVLGDNRNFSFDSRRWGPLRREKIIGMARLRLWPITENIVIPKPSY